MYVGWWNIVYLFKIRVLGPFLASAVVLLSAIELFGPLTHLLDDFLPSSWLARWHTPWIHYAVTICLITAAIAMVLHHRFLEVQSERLKNLLAFTVVAATNLRTLSSNEHDPQTAVGVLDALILSLSSAGDRAKNRKRLNASILMRGAADQSFTIYAQDSANVFKRDARIPARASVAGRVVDYDAGTESGGALLYVPSTQYVHGIVFRGGPVSFRETEISPATYKVVDPTTERDILKCLLCVQIPLKHLSTEENDGLEERRRDGYPIAVLSVSSQGKDCMDSIHFMGAKLAADLIAQFLSQL